MQFRVENPIGTALLDAPSGPRIGILSTNDVFIGTGQTSGGFTEGKTKAGKSGWVLTKDLKSIEGEPRPPVDRGDFVAECVAVEAAFNALPDTAPWFVSADYLIARAIIATDITNAGPKIPGSDAVGPLQVSSSEWNEFLNSGNPRVAEGKYRPGDFDDPLMQINGAAERMRRHAKAISDLRGPGDAGDVFVPSILDVCFAGLTGSPAAALAIRDAEAKNQNVPVDQVLAGPLTAEQIAALLAAPKSFFGAPGAPKALNIVVSEVEKALNDALKAAFDEISEHVPDAIPTAKQGEAPWFDVALEEEKQNIAEPNPRILAYFDSTDFRPRPTSTKTPWCGAFAAHCMKQSGSAEAAAEIPKGSARAANWKSWGAALPAKTTDIPQGAVVVLTPGEGAGGSGHVGFFVRFSDDGKKVELLGGNQSNKVTRTPFATSRIASVAWLDLAPVTAAAAIGEASSKSKISQPAIDLIVASEVSSKKAYEDRYHLPEWPGAASGVTIAIGYDVGYTTKAQLHADWDGKVPAAMVTALESAVGVRGSAAAPLAKRLRGTVDVPWNAAMDVFLKRDIPKWVGIVERALPNTNVLSADCLGALVSLAYNRGASFAKQGDRYAEMRAIRECMANGNHAGIPQLIRNMKRLWPSLRGLQIRRDKEAELFQQGLR